MPRKQTKSILRSPSKKSPRKSPGAASLTNDKGEITKWDSKGRDGRELAIYMEMQ